mmetsp:Transcript_19630/g.63096  ORF Transcript_19630/g.63096 Transcript_19630/m.63096 type:complete len:298 (-) Transcript_19630:1330-2223(-)
MNTYPTRRNMIHHCINSDLAYAGLSESSSRSSSPPPWPPVVLRTRSRSFLASSFSCCCFDNDNEDDDDDFVYLSLALSHLSVPSLMRVSMAKSAGFSLEGIVAPPLTRKSARPAGGPSKTRQPEARRASWSNWQTMVQGGWWIVAMMVRPRSLARFSKVSTTFKAADASSPVVGSSTNMTGRFARRSMPMERRFFWPPEMPTLRPPPTTLSALAARPSFAMMSFTLAILWPRENSAGRRSSAVNMRVWRTVRTSVKCSSWGVTVPIFLKRLKLAFRPSIKTSPSRHGLSVLPSAGST